ncbi:MAG: beta-ketoacyl synthase N-terminal-like domain-containing protein [Pseudomonadota bacterium]
MNTVKAKIIGKGAVSGLGRGCESLWQGLVHGKSAISPVNDIQISDQLPGLGARIAPDVMAQSPAGCFRGHSSDAFFRMCGIVLEEMIPGHERQLETLRQQGLSVFLSTLKGNAVRFEAMVRALKAGSADFQEFLINEPAGVIASVLKARGTTRTCSNACASGTTAVALAADDIRSGRSRASVVLGGDLFTYFIHTGFACLKALSHTPCRPFDKDRDGLTLGEAFAGLCLEKADGREGIQILGSGISNDANHITGPSKTGEGLSRAIEVCLQDAGVRPDQVGAIVAHGTATMYNDAMEVKAYRSVFRDRIPPVCGVKGAIGHTLGAAGIIETIVAVKIIEEGLVPATIGHGTSNHADVSFESRDLRSPVVLNCNSGFGGVNVAVLIGRPDEQS